MAALEIGDQVVWNEMDATHVGTVVVINHKKDKPIGVFFETLWCSMRWFAERDEALRHVPKPRPKLLIQMTVEGITGLYSDTDIEVKTQDYAVHIDDVLKPKVRTDGEGYPYILVDNNVLIEPDPFVI